MFLAQDVNATAQRITGMIFRNFCMGRPFVPMWYRFLSNLQPDILQAIKYGAEWVPDRSALMSLYNTPSTFGSVAKTFHWVIFLLIAGMLAAGFIMTDMEVSPDKFKLYGLHKSFGIMVLTLAV